MQNYDLSIRNFNGPLDILLDLIKDKKMSILDIDLSELATEYLKLINVLKNNNIELAGDYLVMASSLLQLKSKLLLAIPEKETEIIEDKNRLLEQLIRHQQFKKISQILRIKENQRRDIFAKTPENIADFEKEVDQSLLTGNSSVVQIIINLRKMFERTRASKLRKTTLEAFNMSPEERIAEIKIMFEKKDELSFKEVFSTPTLKHFSITLLAILDMARLQMIKLEQDEQFGIIKILKGDLYGEE